MKIQFTREAWKDFEWFLDNDKKVVKRIRELIKDILRHPQEGMGKPERHGEAAGQSIDPHPLDPFPKREQAFQFPGLAALVFDRRDLDPQPLAWRCSVYPALRFRSARRGQGCRIGRSSPSMRTRPWPPSMRIRAPSGIRRVALRTPTTAGMRSSRATIEQ